MRQPLTLRRSALLVVREGPDGCLATGGELGDKVLGVPAPQVCAVDTTGAGDTHIGVLLAGLARGQDVAGALVTANRAAAISVARVARRRLRGAPSWPDPARRDQAWV